MTESAATWLETSHAFHSELLEPVLDEFESYAAQLQFAVPTLPLVCNRTGAVLTAETPLDAQYWRRHSRQPVQFAESVRTVAALGCSVVMEIGPQPILTAAALQVWPESSAAPRAIVSLRKGADARRQIAEALAATYIAGHRPEFAALHHRPRRRLELPTYPFQRRRFWPKTSGIHARRRRCRYPESWVAQRISPPATPSTPVGCRVKSQPWLSDHVIYGTVVVPGATYAAMALAAAGAPARVQEVFFYEPIILSDKSSREVQLTLHPLEDGGGWTFQVHSRPYGVREAEWSLNADGTVVTGVDDEPAPSAESVDVAIERLSRTRPQQLFDTFADMELAWGPTWSTSLKSLWVGEGEAIGDVAVGDELAEHLGSEPIHPVLLDLCTGVAFPAFPALLAATQNAGVLARSVLAAAVRAGGAAGADATAVLLPREMAGRWCRQRDAGLRPRFRGSGWPPPGRNSRVHGETRAAGGVVARARRRCDPAAVHPRLARGAAPAVARRFRKRQAAPG